MPDVLRGRRPGKAALPDLIRDNLVADLDRVMTVEKSIVAMWKRTAGHSNDVEGRSFPHKAYERGLVAGGCGRELRVVRAERRGLAGSVRMQHVRRGAGEAAGEPGAWHGRARVGLQGGEERPTA